MPLSIGEILEGNVTKLLPYGAIVELSDDVTGLVHISEIAQSYVKEVSDYLHEGDVVQVKILAEKEPGKWELSIKQADPKFAESTGGGGRGSQGVSKGFERRLTDFMQESNRRQNEIRRSREARRGGS